MGKAIGLHDVPEKIPLDNSGATMAVVEHP
jgi:hypothetical protein